MHAALRKLQFTPEKHPAEDALQEVFENTPGVDAGGVSRARKAGLSWASILALLVQFGPLFDQALRLLLQGLDQEPLEPTPQQARSESKPGKAAEQPKTPPAPHARV